MRVTMRKTWLPWLILSPSLLFLLLFTWFPLGRSVYDSLFDTRMASDGAQYVGLDNFARLFADNVFWQSLGNNLLYILLTVVPGVTLALLLAVALSENHRVNRWLRTAFFFPMIIPMVSAAALWLFIFMPGLGLLDHYLAKLFGPMNNNWLGRSNSALLALALIGVWKFAGYYMLFFLAGLQSIPASTREAALMEGAPALPALPALPAPDPELCDHHRADLLHHPDRPRGGDDPRRAGQRHHRAALLHPESRLGYPRPRQSLRRHLPDPGRAVRLLAD